MILTLLQSAGREIGCEEVQLQEDVNVCDGDARPGPGQCETADQGGGQCGDHSSRQSRVCVTITIVLLVAYLCFNFHTFLYFCIQFSLLLYSHTCIFFLNLISINQSINSFYCG